MAHVAEASEANGRVLFLMDMAAGDASQAAIAAARFASSFNAEIEAVSFNSDAVGRARLLPVTCVKTARADADAANVLERAQVHQEIVTARQFKAIAEAARRAGVPHFRTAVAGEPVDQIDSLCLSRGPWNVIVLAAPASEQTADCVSAIFANVSGATGIVAVPSRCPHESGPIAIVVEDAERLPAMLRAAGRLKGLCSRVHMIVAADTRHEMEALDAHVRLTTANHKGLVIETPSPLLGVAGALDETLRALKTSFIVARFGGALLPHPQAMARTMAVACAPFLLVR